MLVVTKYIGDGRYCDDGQVKELFETFTNETGWNHGDPRKKNCLWCEKQKKYIFIDFENARVDDESSAVSFLTANEKSNSVFSSESDTGIDMGQVELPQG